MKKHRSDVGFTLIEMLLVMVIISIIIYAGIGYVQRRTEQMRVDRTSLQMQQILSAGLAFNVTKGSWPSSLSTDLMGTYLPKPTSGTIVNPWNKSYCIGVDSSANVFYVWSAITSAKAGVATLEATQVANTLPLAYTSTNNVCGSTPPSQSAPCDTSSTTCLVVSGVNIPGQNLNNATAVNFAGVYKHGACVPVPVCPKDSTGATMTPQIFVVPVSVSGVNDATATGGSPNVYPIESFTAYSTGGYGVSYWPARCTGATSETPTQDCRSGLNPSGSTPATDYWRVCLDVVTTQGKVAGTGGTASTYWGQWVRLLAFTRCAPNAEPSGSSFTVYSN